MICLHRKDYPLPGRPWPRRAWFWAALAASLWLWSGETRAASSPSTLQTDQQAARDSEGDDTDQSRPPADEAGTDREQARITETTEAAQNSWGEISGDLGFGSLGQDLVTSLGMGWDISEGNLAAGLGALIRFKTVDLGGPEPMGFRHKDWDEPSDFAHVLRYLTYRKDVSSVQLGMLAGELTGASLGHGTLLSQYMSLADLDHPHSGAWFHVGSRYVDLDLLAADFVRPDLFGARVTARPVPKLAALQVGVTVMADLKTPRSLDIEADGRLAQDRTGRYQGQTDPLVAATVDLQYRHKEGRILFVPYADGNWLSAGGGGLHAGLEAHIETTKWKLGLKAEYHLAVGAYWSAYFDRFHDLQRYDAFLGRTGSNQAIPKLALLEGLESIRHGGRWEAKFSYKKLVRIQAGYDLRLGPIGDLAWIDLEMPYSRNLVAGMTLAKTGLSSKETWKEDKGLLMGLEARWRILEHLYLLGRVQHLHRASPTGYEGIWLTMGAVGGAFSY